MALGRRWIFMMIGVAGGLIFFFSLWDVSFEYGFQWFYILSYIFLLIGGIILLFFLDRVVDTNSNHIEIFEKSLKGRLNHFKCPFCHGVFAIKESCKMKNREYILTCPDCGHLGRISISHPIIFQEVPHQKSKNVHLECAYCGEHVKIWAEGTTLYPYISVFSCPFCKVKEPLVRI